MKKGKKWTVISVSEVKEVFFQETIKKCLISLPPKL